MTMLYQYLISVFIFIASFLIFIFYGPNYNKQSATVDFVVREGATLNIIIDDLYAEGIISNKFNIKIAAFLLGVDKDIKAGHYDIPNGISYVGLLDLLNEGAPKKQKLVTIQEGIWQEDLAELLSTELSLSKEEILKLSKDRHFRALPHPFPVTIPHLVRILPTKSVSPHIPVD